MSILQIRHISVRSREIDLINGEELVKRLKELAPGARITMVESVEVDLPWFERL